MSYKNYRNRPAFKLSEQQLAACGALHNEFMDLAQEHLGSFEDTDEAFKAVNVSLALCVVSVMKTFRIKKKKNEYLGEFIDLVDQVGIILKQEPFGSAS